MDGEPRLLLWAFTEEERDTLNTLLARIGAPSAKAIRKNQAMVPLSKIIHQDKTGEISYDSAERVLLFYNIPQQGVMFLINFFKQQKLPACIYAVVTEHSMEWPFHQLLEHLIEERESFERNIRESDQPGH